ncbi:hypothetical protein GDO81_017748 [Engystomops pustulosus]|uniref:Uncharacterized protein n=1 Tax=Engystomops pustulosus TaxID=76066 RepID=A0AAV7ABV8_ENGPU|nr:hypothetical protein GDO81_017748 [Engystomops pustulosus]
MFSCGLQNTPHPAPYKPKSTETSVVHLIFAFDLFLRITCRLVLKPVGEALAQSTDTIWSLPSSIQPGCNESPRFSFSKWFQPMEICCLRHNVQWTYYKEFLCCSCIMLNQ